MSTISAIASTFTKWNAQRQPNVFATHVPTGTPTTDAIEKPENTHAMNFVRYRSAVTSGDEDSRHHEHAIIQRERAQHIASKKHPNQRQMRGKTRYNDAR